MRPGSAESSSGWPFALSRMSHASSWRTAFYHGAQHRTIEGGGHFPHLDIGAEAVARDVLDWINELGA